MFRLYAYGTECIIYYAASLLMFKKVPNVVVQLCASSSHLFSYSSSVAFFSQSSFVQNPFSTHRNNPPAKYCIKQYLVSPFCIVVLEWRRRADGRRMVAPGGNWIMTPRSHSTRCPPRVGSWLERGVSAQNVLGELPTSTWSTDTDCWPRLSVVAANAVLVKLRLSSGLLA